MTKEERRDLIEDLEYLAKDLSRLNGDLRNLDTTNNLYVMDSLGVTNGDLIVSFDKDNSEALKLLVKTHLENLSASVLCKISTIVEKLIYGDTKQ